MLSVVILRPEHRISRNIPGRLYGYFPVLHVLNNTVALMPVFLARYGVYPIHQRVRFHNDILSRVSFYTVRPLFGFVGVPVFNCKTTQDKIFRNGCYGSQSPTRVLCKASPFFVQPHPYAPSQIILLQVYVLKIRFSRNVIVGLGSNCSRHLLRHLYLRLSIGL